MNTMRRIRRLCGLLAAVIASLFVIWAGARAYIQEKIYTLSRQQGFAVSHMGPVTMTPYAVHIRGLTLRSPDFTKELCVERMSLNFSLKGLFTRAFDHLHIVGVRYVGDIFDHYSGVHVVPALQAAPLFLPVKQCTMSGSYHLTYEGYHSNKSPIHVLSFTSHYKINRQSAHRIKTHARLFSPLLTTTLEAHATLFQNRTYQFEALLKNTHIFGPAEHVHLKSINVKGQNGQKDAHEPHEDFGLDSAPICAITLNAQNVSLRPKAFAQQDIPPKPKPFYPVLSHITLKGHFDRTYQHGKGGGQVSYTGETLPLTWRLNDESLIIRTFGRTRSARLFEDLITGAMHPHPFFSKDSFKKEKNRSFTQGNVDIDLDLCFSRQQWLESVYKTLQGAENSRVSFDQTALSKTPHKGYLRIILQDICAQNDSKSFVKWRLEGLQGHLNFQLFPWRSKGEQRVHARALHLNDLLFLKPELALYAPVQNAASQSLENGAKNASQNLEHKGWDMFSWVRRFEASVFGGKLKLHSFTSKKDCQTLSFDWENFAMDQALKYLNIQGLFGSGPMTGRGKICLNRKGRHTLHPTQFYATKGGVIRYQGIDVPGVGKVFDNLHYTMLTLHIEEREGELRGALDILGYHPQLTKGHPHRFQLDISQDIYPLLFGHGT